MAQQTVLAGVPFRSCVFAAAGCAGTGRELARYCDISAFGAVVTRSVTTEPRAGAPSPRLAETPSGVLNALGLPGPGIEQFLAAELPWLVDNGVTVIVSIAGESAAEFAKLAQRLRQTEGVAGIEVNLSNPIGPPGRWPFAMDASASAGIVHAVRRNTAAGVPVFAKLSGDTTDIVAIARACAAAGADGVSLINAVRGVGIDRATRRPALGAVMGGLSGPAIRPIALRAVWEVHAALPQVPIIASGGVATGADALEMILAGASAVAVGTALLQDPAAGHRVAEELDRAIAASGSDLPGIVGSAHREAPS